MADDQIQDNEDYMQDAGSSPAGNKKLFGFMPAIVLTILKWVGLVLIAIILIVAVSIVVNIVMNKGNKEKPEQTEEMTISLSKYDYFVEPLKNMRIQGQDKSGPFTVMVDVQLGYEEGNKAMANELSEKTYLILDNIRSFFSSRSQAELSPINEKKLKTELKSRLNQLLSSGQIDVVLFSNFFRMAQ